MANLRREPIDLEPINLAAVSQQRRIFPTFGAIGISVSATKAAGAWATRTLELKRRVGGRSDSFATPKTIAAGGGTVQASTDDLSGVDELELTTVGAAEAGANLILARVTYETEDTSPVPPAAGGVSAGGNTRRGNIDEGPSSLPAPEAME